MKRLALVLLAAGIAAGAFAVWRESAPPPAPTPTPEPAEDPARRELDTILAFERSDPEFDRKAETLSRYETFIDRHRGTPWEKAAAEKRAEYLRRAELAPAPSVAPRRDVSTLERDLGDLYLQSERSVRQALAARRYPEAGAIVRDFLYRPWTGAQ